MDTVILNNLIASAELRNPDTYNASRERYIAEISYNAGRHTTDSVFRDMYEVLQKLSRLADEEYVNRFLVMEVRKVIARVKG